MPIVIRRKVVAPPPEPVITPVKASRGEMLDGMCRAVMAKGPNSVVSWWLMAGYMYYVHGHADHLGRPVRRDAKVMVTSWDEITHQHKRLITPEHLKSGSLYDLKPEDYPIMCRPAPHIW